MEGIVGLFVFAIIVFVVSLAATVWGSYRRRLEELEKALSDVKRIERWTNPQVIRDLTARVYLIEKALNSASVTTAPPAEPPAARPVPLPPPLPPPVRLPPPVVVAPLPEPEVAQATPVAPPPPKPPEPAPRTEPKLAPPPPKPPAAVPAPGPVPVPAFASAGAEPEKWQDRLREKAGGRDWEATIGGNWLNKIGAAVLVIGIALFLSYSITKMGPAGRVALALGVSVTLLAAGVVLERRSGYVVFARGLLGAGWAALYSTAYAMHALEAARVIQNPVAGAVLLLTVSVGMIVHSLRYRSQTVTGLAYFIAFLSLNLTPLTGFAVLASVPLAASLLFLAQRFSWFRMAIFGIVATYGTAVLKSTGTATLAETQSLLGVFWLVFEGFDLIRVSRRVPATLEALAIFPLNAIGAMSLSLAKWLSAAPGRIHGLYAGAATAYLVSAAIRGLLRRPSSFPDDAEPADRAISGYHAAITLAAAGAVFGIFARLSGIWIVVALAVEAELLFLFGFALRQRYLRALALGVFGIGAADLAIQDMPGERGVSFAGRNWLQWSPAALLMAALFYLNRVLKRPGLVYSWAACAALGVVAGFEAPAGLRGPAWLVLAFVLFQIGFWLKLPEFRWQGYTLAVASWVALAAANLLDTGVSAAEGAWRWLAAAAAVQYVASAQMVWIRRLDEEEQRWARYGASWAGTFLLAGFIWKWVPPVWLGTGWLILAFLLFQVGFWLKLPEFRWQAYTAATVSWITLVAVNLFDQGLSAAGVSWGWLVWAAAIDYAVSGQMVWIRRLPEEEQRGVRDAASWAGTFFVAAVLWKWLPEAWLGAGWLALAVALFEVGLLLRVASFRRQAAAAGALGYGALVWINALEGAAPALQNAAVLGAAMLLSYPLAMQLNWFGAKRLSAAERRLTREVASLAGTIFLAALVWYAVPPPLVAVGWALIALLLIESGLPLSWPFLRAQGHAMAAIASGRLFFSNFTTLGSTSGVSHRLLTVAPLIVMLYCLWSRLGDEDARLEPWERAWRRFYLWMPAVLAAVLARFELGRTLVVVGWAAFGLLLLYIGARHRNRDLRHQSYGLAALTFFRSWNTNFYVPESFGGVRSRVLTGAAVVASFFLAEFIARRPGDYTEAEASPTLVDRHARKMFSLLATVLLAVLIFYEVSGSLLTVAWGLEGLLVLCLGFPTRERVLRLAGLALFTFCVLKLFAYDLRELDTPNRILSFIVLGLLLLGVSWIYTRFRERIRRFL